MTDIVERVRETIGGWLPTKLGWEAADEIERLRAEIEQLTAERANRYWEGRWRDEKAENERLHGLFRIDGEQHAAYIKELEARHEIRHKHYCAEIERLRAQIIAAQPEDDWDPAGCR